MDSVSEERHRREYREAVRTERLSGWEEVKETTDDSIFLQEIVTESSSDTVAVDTLVITSAQSANS